MRYAYTNINYLARIWLKMRALAEKELFRLVNIFRYLWLYFQFIYRIEVRPFVWINSYLCGKKTEFAYQFINMKMSFMKLYIQFGMNKGEKENNVFDF